MNAVPSSTSGDDGVSLALSVVSSLSTEALRSIVVWTVAKYGGRPLPRRVEDDLVAMLAHHVRQVAIWMANRHPWPEDVEALVDKGYLPATACLSMYLQDLGQAGKEFCEQLEADQRCGDRSIWLENNVAEPSVYAARMVAGTLWLDHVRPWWTHRSSLTLQAIESDGDVYVLLPKLVMPLSWAWGAERQTDEAEQSPRSEPLLSARHQGPPHHAWWPLVRARHPTRGEREDTPFVVSPQAAKLFFLLLAARTRRLITTRLSTLTRLLHGHKGRVQVRDTMSTVRALRELEHLAIVLEDGTQVRLVHVEPLPDLLSRKGSTKVSLGLTPWFHHLLGQSQAPAEAAHPRVFPLVYRGQVMVNLSGLLRLSDRHPALLRYYLRCAALWNAAHRQGRFHERAMPPRSAQDWAILANQVHRGVVEELAAKRAGKGPRAGSKPLTTARASARRHLRLLQTEKLLVLNELKSPKPPRLALLLPLPPLSLRKAKAAWRASESSARLVDGETMGLEVSVFGEGEEANEPTPSGSRPTKKTRRAGA